MIISTKSIQNIRDLTCGRFGDLFVIGYAGKPKSNRAHWWCVCDCGRSVCVEAVSLTKGRTRSCGCQAAKLRLETMHKEGRRPHKTSILRDIESRGVRAIKDRCTVVDSGCWEWNYARSTYGYGVIPRGSRKLKGAHRAAYIAAKGEIPNGMVVMHKCDNPPCCNPDHLVIGTHAENQYDKVSKGRHAIGEQNGRSKLNENIVYMLKKMSSRSDFSTAEWAKFYGVDKRTISLIVEGKTWKHVVVG